MTPAEFRELLSDSVEDGPILRALAEFWEAAEKTRLERFRSVPGKGAWLGDL